jgi:Glycosyltransferase family 87
VNVSRARTEAAPPAVRRPRSPTRRGAGLVAAAIVLAAVLLPVAARIVADGYQSDTVWGNALASLGGAQRNGDFGYVFLPAGDAVLSGESPYLDPDDFTGPAQAPYAYPPVLAFLITPLSALPEWVAGTFVPGAIFSVLLVAAVAGALFLLEVRDWRCYPIALLYPATLESIEYGAIGPVLLLLIALAWRVRDRPWGAGAAAGGAVVLKLFLWPLLLWLAMTQRLRSAVIAVIGAAALAFASWSLIAFRGIWDYPPLLRKLVDIEAENSYSAFALLRMLDLPDTPARLLVAAAGLALIGLAWRTARAAAGTSRERDRRSLTLVVAAALVATPILWLHYLVLLVVPVALARPRLSALWFAPLLLTVFELLDWYRGWPYGDPEALVSVAGVVALVFLGSLWARRPPRGDREAAIAGAG